MTELWAFLMLFGIIIIIGIFLLIAFGMIPPADRHIAYVGAIEQCAKILIVPNWFYISAAAVLIAQMFFAYMKRRPRV